MATRNPAVEVDARAQMAYLLGAPILLSDLLALPPDGNRYDRDEKGRLILMAPDDAARHRTPVALVAAELNAALDRSRFAVVPEAPVAFERTYSLDGTELPPSHHGPKALVPDVSCFSRPMRYVTAPSGHTWYSPAGLLLVVEVLSPTTWASDLGEGASREGVDRWRTYLENGVAEYWILNAGFERCGLPPRSGLFLSYDRERAAWSELAVDRPSYSATDYRGRRPVATGTVRSQVLPELSFDLEQFWGRCGSGD